MEKPDENGFVTVNWPSKNVPHGGVFHHPIVEPSEAKQKLLKVLLNESKLTVAQRQKSKWENSLRTEDPPPRRHQASSAAAPLVRPRTSRRRSLSTIRESGDYEVEGFRPLKRGGDREKLKERLQRAMEHGDTELVQPPPLRKPKPAPALPTRKEMRNDLLTQIRERAEWLAEMEELGAAAAHRDVVMDQIAERVRGLDALGSRGSSARTTGSAGAVRCREVVFPEPGVRSARERPTMSASTASKSSSNRSSARGRRGQEEDENVSLYSDLPKLRYSARRRC
ncbi:UPF0193 protein EVG1 homolog [Plutella xylostella]|uniref:UPF0193 protein EVG1 homolog n=1 Tax=Plutella xylostella TaxID=51655 RepID=UPI0020331759|nr:UPF0193 protein EVG1 homolog [Plutella xylostella]